MSNSDAICEHRLQSAGRTVSRRIASSAALVMGALLALMIGACSATPEPLTTEQLNRLLEDFERDSRQAAAQRAAARQHGIHRLDVSNPAAPLAQQRVTALLENAHIGAVIERLGLNYTLDGMSRISGRVTARFENLVMPEALQALLGPAQMQATLNGEMVVIRRIPELPLAMTSEDDYIFHKWVMRYADTRTLEPLLDTLLSDGSDDDDDDDDDDYDIDVGDSLDDDSGSEDDGSDDNQSTTAQPSKSLTFTALHAENAILLKGPSANVRNAMDILRAVDTDTGHIMMQATVLEFSVTDLLQVGTRISQGSSGNFSDVSIDWASLAGDTISFTNLSGAANTRGFRAAISMLLQTDQARIMARPYMAAIPGYEAKIDVAEDRYVTTVTEDSGEITLQPVTSGITMTITPFLLPEEQIRMDLAVSVSQFIPTLDNVQLARSRSDASSTMRIGSGETIVIGGLKAEQSSKSNAGVPGARSVPGLGFLFGERKSTDLERRVIVYITPHIWDPGMDTPQDTHKDLENYLESSQKGFDNAMEGG